MSLKRLAPVTAIPPAKLSTGAGALFRVQPATPGINIRASALIAQNYNVAGRIFN